MLAILGALISYVVFLGIYSYNNPDMTQCWWIKGLPTSYSSEEAAIAAGEVLTPQVIGTPMNIH